MPVVGTLAYQVVADTGGLTSGLAGSRTELKTLKDAFLQSMPAAEMYNRSLTELERLAIKFPQAGKEIERAIHQIKEEMHEAEHEASLMGRVQEHLTEMFKNFTFVTDPVALTFHAIEEGADLVKEAFHETIEVGKELINHMKELNALSKRADLIGVSESSLMGLAGAAKVLSNLDLASFEQGFTQLTRHIGEAAEDSESKAGKAFTKLGLDAGKLSAMSPDKAFLAIADAMEKIENPAERLQIGFAIAGRQGFQLASTLAAGGERVRELAEEAEKLQQAKFIDFESIKEANVQMIEFEHVMEGITNLLASDLAPLVTHVMSDLNEMFGTATTDGNELRDTIHGIAIALGHLTDTAERAFSVRGFLTGFVGPQIGPNEQAVLDAQLRADNRKPSRAPEEIESAKAAERAQKLQDKEDKINKTAAEKIGEMMDEVNVQIMNHADKIKEDNKKAGEAIGKMMDEVNVSIQHKGEQFRDSLRTVPEKLRDSLEEIQSLSRLGAIDDETLQRGLEDIRDKAREGLGDNATGTTEAVRAGSIEAIRAKFGAQSTDEKSLAEQKKQTKNQADMKDILEKVKTQLASMGALGVIP